MILANNKKAEITLDELRAELGPLEKMVNHVLNGTRGSFDRAFDSIMDFLDWDNRELLIDNADIPLGTVVMEHCTWRDGHNHWIPCAVRHRLGGEGHPRGTHYFLEPVAITGAFDPRNVYGMTTDLGQDDYGNKRGTLPEGSLGGIWTVPDLIMQFPIIAELHRRQGEIDLPTMFNMLHDRGWEQHAPTLIGNRFGRRDDAKLVF